MRMPCQGSLLAVPRGLVLALLLAAAPPGMAQQAWADEDRDWGVAPVLSLRQAPYSAPTPMTIPGARVARTVDMNELVGRQPAPILIDVAGGEGHFTVPGALWYPGAGRGTNYMDIVQGALAERLGELTGGDKSRPIAFFCVNAQCWLSYNASLRAAALGYTAVYWYRGGTEAWREAGLPMARTSREGPATEMVEPPERRQAQ